MTTTDYKDIIRNRPLPIIRMDEGLAMYCAHANVYNWFRVVFPAIRVYT